MAIASDPIIQITAGAIQLEGNLVVPPGAKGIVLFAHGSGSSRHSPRNLRVASALQQSGLATLLIDLLTGKEEQEDARSAHLRFDIGLLASRLLVASDWLERQPHTRQLKAGYFGASTGAAAALVAAADRPERVSAIVSRGGRPDLAGAALPHVQAPTLLIAGGDDVPVIGLNRQAYAQMKNERKLSIIPGATHLFEEPGALEQVSQLAADWFARHL